MKKLLCITAITIFGFTNAQAQEVEFGAKIGANFSSIYGDTNDNVELITSVINFGVYSEFALSEKLSFQPEIMYSIQGFSLTDDLTGTDNIVSLNYLNVPLMGKYHVTKGLSLEAGPQIGFLLSAKNEDIDVKDTFKSIDFGINLGLEYKLENGLNFGARYNFGLLNINDIEGSSDKFRNGVAQFTIGYSLF